MLDAGIYIEALPEVQYRRREWRIATEMLLAVADGRWPPRFAEIAIGQALKTGGPSPLPPTGRKVKSAKWSGNASRLIRHTNVASRSLVGRLQIRLPCVYRYLKHWICFEAPEVSCVEPHGIKPLRVLPLPKRVCIREDVAAI
jgi:hypothetical protein